MNWSTLAFTSSRIDGRFAQATVPSTSVARPGRDENYPREAEQDDILPHADWM